MIILQDALLFMFNFFKIAACVQTFGARGGKYAFANYVVQEEHIILYKYILGKAGCITGTKQMSSKVIS